METLPYEPRHAGTGPAGRLVAGRYRLGALLGRGGMGSVWLADDELLGRPVALKRADEPGRTLDEARAAASVVHRGTVRILDLVRDGGEPWIVMEALSGRTLADVLREDGPLAVERVRRVGLSLLDALEAVHRAGIVHRDVKPGNVQLCAEGRVVLIDFGIACSWAYGPRPPAEGFEGSPAYVSPEQLRGAPPEPASDLFTLGATLYAAVEGRSPFDRGDLFATMLAVTEATPAPFRLAGPLRPVIEGLLAADPARRCTLGQAREALVAADVTAVRRPMPETCARRMIKA
ncbi:serine/threonine-protein kinase [Paractinoplanes hotanensis]|uniref:non-specific serine/threonine protein kinase n=1 Tax=Paractinoplanes hotanensis TaxID=2906497 RepID=A0ABT0XRF8_9ACTN|nr:serine/threonine-protein kinase [Actinoplanes hotanensis]MCM4076359.1 serine/threonine protein kinase [Actinoplanes hotanensis]